MCPAPDAIDHRIRLRGPWEVQFQGHQDCRTPPDGTTIHKLPAGWEELFGERPGLATFRRSFNRPTGLTQSSHVWLAVKSPGGTVSLKCNDTDLEADVCGEWLRFELTGALQPHNRIELRLLIHHIPDGPDERIGLWAPVELWLAD